MAGMTHTPRSRGTGMLKAPRSRGMLSGLLLILLALWGGLIPFIGPYFHFGFGPDDAWVYTSDRLVLSILPAIAVGVGGLILLVSSNRPIALFGSWLAILGGLWFVVGATIAAQWDVSPGAALGGQTRRIAEQLSFFHGLGSIIVLLAAVALGRFLVVGVREARRAEAGRGESKRAAAAGQQGGRGSSTAPEWENQAGSRPDDQRPATPGQRTWRTTPRSRR
ncbi:hypothetical protein [Actinomadura darangshiensis]|uniref:hypothetical protein n=1 Tax=Actinomadura darangshiensis TaxID=705336 RepID=UPI001FB84C40|nr:hypothetical protein [Actinomadura darangshiensis]